MSTVASTSKQIRFPRALQVTNFSHVNYPHPQIWKSYSTPPDSTNTHCSLQQPVRYNLKGNSVLCKVSVLPLALFISCITMQSKLVVHLWICLWSWVTSYPLCSFSSWRSLFQLWTKSWIFTSSSSLRCNFSTNSSSESHRIYYTFAKCSKLIQ